MSGHVPSRYDLLLRPLFRWRPLVRCVLYGISIDAVSSVLGHIIDPSRTDVWSISRSSVLNILATPFILGLTYGFVMSRKEDNDWWQRVVLTNRGRQFTLGLVLGTAAFLAVASTATVLGWVRFPQPGWHTASKTAVIWTLISRTAHLCVAWNEEMLFRGYGLHSLAQVVGRPFAVAILVPVFARGHGSGWQMLIGQSALGLSTTALRFAGGSLWLPVGYHAAWNYVQTAIFGPPDAPPSLLPMHIEGPELWMGRPGYPEPGLLSTLVNLIVAGGAAWVWWRARRRAPRHAHRQA